MTDATNNPSDSEDFAGWCIVELLGHRRLGAYVTVQEIAGMAFLRLDVPATSIGDPASRPGGTQFVNPSSLYALTPTTEQIARTIAEAAPMPVTRWEVQAIEARARGSDEREFSGSAQLAHETAIEWSDDGAGPW